MIIDEEMLDYVMDNVGECFDYGINYLNIEGNVFLSLFAKSNVCKLLQKGEPYVAYGMSGIEMCNLLVTEFKLVKEKRKEEYDSSEFKSTAYWIGWISAYYCLTQDISFSRLFCYVSYDNLQRYYIAYHQQDESSIVSLFNSLTKKQKSNLQKIRLERNLSQKELSIISGVSVRIIQAYEQNYKDINRCEARTLYKLSLALNVPMESLLKL